MSTIGSKIRCARETIGITQEQLGKLCGTTKQTIFKYENDIVTNIPMDRIETIAHHLRITPSYLMGWADAPGEIHPDNSKPSSNLSALEQDLIRKFRKLDDRGKSAVLNTLEYEYKSLTGEETTPHPRQA